MTSVTMSAPGLLDLHAADRFWGDVRLGAADDCWPRVGQRGTGHIRIWHQGVKMYAHRVAFLLGGGHIGEGEVVRHATCDRPECMNYLHMRPGTSADNTRDREQRNRRTPLLPHGERHWSATLSDTDASRIRAAKQLGLSARVIARMFEVPAPRSTTSGRASTTRVGRRTSTVL